MERHPAIKLILRRETVLTVFVLSAVVSTAVTDFDASGENTVLPLLSLVVFPVLAWFTHKRALLATWCTVLLLIMTGSGFIYDAFIDLMKSDEPSVFLSLFSITFGIYLTWGALLLHRERHGRD